MGNLPLKGVSSFESFLSQVPERRSLAIRFTSFCRKFSLSPILLNWMAHSTSGSAGTRVGLGWALLRALLPGISADGRRQTGATQRCNPSTSGLQDAGCLFGLHRISTAAGRASSSCSKRGYTSLRCVKLGLQSAGSVAAGHRLGCPRACGIFPHQGENPGPLHGQVDSSPLDCQGSPCPFVLIPK